MILEPAYAGGGTPRRPGPPRMRVEDLHHQLPPPRRPGPLTGLSLRNTVVIVVLAMWAMAFATSLIFPADPARTQIFQAMSVAAPTVIGGIFAFTKGTP